MRLLIGRPSPKFILKQFVDPEKYFTEQFLVGELAKKDSIAAKGQRRQGQGHNSDFERFNSEVQGH